MKDVKRSAGSQPTAAPRRATDAVPNLDADSEFNLRIIELLQEDGRMPFSTIADKLGVSEGTVRNRVKQLRDDNIMQISAAVLPEAFGYHWNSVVFLKLNAGVDIDKVAQRLARIPEVYYVVHITGQHDLAVTSFHRDREHFREFLNKHCYGHTDILSVDANVNLKVYKVSLRWSGEGLVGGS